MATPLAYTYTLTAGQPENVNQLNQNLTDIKTVINTDTETAFSSYKELKTRVGNVPAAATGTYILPGVGDSDAGGVRSVVGAPAFAAAGFYLDPSDYTANTRTTKFRVRAQLLTNTTAPAASFTVGLYPVATFGTSSTFPSLASLSAVTTGSTVVFTTPALSTQSQGNSGDFTAPAAGWYVLGVVVSTGTAVSSSEHVAAQLQMRQV